MTTPLNVSIRFGSPANAKDTEMYAHILIATDGSELSNKALVEGASLAKHLAAKVTIVTAVVTQEPVFVEDELIGPDKRELQEIAQSDAMQILATGKQIIESAGVICRTVSAIDRRPYEIILETAEANGCDLIVMASHGRSGIGALLVGSETQKVLTHGTLPVLVHRA
jgi:nucleotide-binding universal stress UspA family protein